MSLTNSSSVKLNTFTRFPDLPPEIRLMIWRLLPEPSIIPIDALNVPTCGLASPMEHPAGLDICQEARNELLPPYPASFGCFLQAEHIRFNFDRDILWPMYCDEEKLNLFLSVLKESKLRNLRYFAIDDCAMQNPDTLKMILKVLRTMKEVKGFFVLREPVDYYNTAQEIMEFNSSTKFYIEQAEGAIGLKCEGIGLWEPGDFRGESWWYYQDVLKISPVKGAASEISASQDKEVGS